MIIHQFLATGRASRWDTRRHISAAWLKSQTYTTNMMKSFKIEETDALIGISVDDSSVMFPQKWNFHYYMKLGHTGWFVHCILWARHILSLCVLMGKCFFFFKFIYFTTWFRGSMFFILAQMFMWLSCGERFFLPFFLWQSHAFQFESLQFCPLPSWEKHERRNLQSLHLTDAWEATAEDLDWDFGSVFPAFGC